MPDIDQIISFFLNLFKLESQKAGLNPGPADYRRIPGFPGNEAVYELRVQTGSEWKTRRMSIRKLGEAVESKSTCYKVIYDDQIVVKIPPKPIMDFTKYIEQIHKERHVAQQLSSGIPCVWPTLSAILVKVPGPLELGDETDAALEDRCVKLVTRTPSLQIFLKIGAGFVFFMNLARNEFLNQIIEQIHDETTRIKKEFIHSARLFDSLEAFEAVYGDTCDVVFFSINQLCRKFQKKIDSLMVETDASSVASYKTREWFFSFLTDEPPDMAPDLIPEELVATAGEIFSSLMHRNKNAVEQYRKTVEKTYRKQIFISNRTAMEGLVVNILKLLYRLQARGVAVRDLKSDNIFIAGHSENSMYHLWDHESYDLGLIDLETGIDVKPSEPDAVKQPSLAGTPSYMTPAHMFKNPILEAALDVPLEHAMYMQDWFAAVGMIYNTATGRLLFVKTARLIPQMVQMKKTALIQKTPLVRLFRHVSCIFWDVAEKEFMEKLGRTRNRFNAIRLRLPGAITVMLKTAIQEESAAIKKTMKMLIAATGRLKPDGRYLLDASAAGVAAYRKNREIKAVKAGGISQEARKTLSRLETLERMKRRLENHDQEADFSGGSMVCYDLLVFLMNRIMYVMRPPSWKEWN